MTFLAAMAVLVSVAVAMTDPYADSDTDSMSTVPAVMFAFLLFISGFVGSAVCLASSRQVPPDGRARRTAYLTSAVAVALSVVVPCLVVIALKLAVVG